MIRFGYCPACGTGGTHDHIINGPECVLLQADRFQKHSPVDQADDQ